MTKENLKCKCGHSQDYHVEHERICTKIGCWCNRFIEAKFQPAQKSESDEQE